MEYIEPTQDGYTIYSKSGCHFCTKAKQLLKSGNEKNVLLVDCDEYLFEDKQDFLNFIKDKNNGIEYKTFPMIFHKGKFIGGFKELETYYNKEKAFENSDF